MMNHPLNRFLDAQDTDGSFTAALAEIKAGKKTGHWSWWTFPQMRGLSTSQRGVYFGIEDEVEAREYLLHPMLRFRLRLAFEALAEQALEGNGIEDVMGELDAKKVRSCLDLFVPTAESIGSPECILLAAKGRVLMSLDKVLSPQE